LRLSADRIKKYYQDGFKEKRIHREWPQLWNKQFKIETPSNRFLKLNRIKDRLRFNSLKELCVEYTPLHLYMSSLNWLMPERVNTKEMSRYTYPIGGEYVIDIDRDMNYKPHRHHNTEDGICKECLGHAKELTEKILDIVTRY
jgi:DNA primase catalytic subunit